MILYSEQFEKHWICGTRCGIVVAKGSGKMPKYITSYAVAEFKSVTKISDKPYDEWKWRERYIGFQGELFIFESAQRHPGKRYLNFTDHSRNWLNTGYGEYVIEGNILTMTTKNSIYEFEIIHNGGYNNAEKIIN